MTARRDKPTGDGVLVTYVRGFEDIKWNALTGEAIERCTAIGNEGRCDLMAGHDGYHHTETDDDDPSGFNWPALGSA